MNDLQLWRDLALRDDGTAATAPDAARLEALAEVPVELRWPFFGRLQSALAADDPAVRAAAVRCLRGANGTPAWKWLVSALEDAAPGVVLEAVDALRTSAKSDPERWVHVLFHRNPDVRRQALLLAARVPRHWLLYLLTDPETADAAMAEIGRVPELAPSALPLLLKMALHGHLPRIEAVRWLIALRWDKRTMPLFRGIEEADLGFEGLVALMTAPWDDDDPSADEGRAAGLRWTTELGSAIRRSMVYPPQYRALGTAIARGSRATATWRADTLVIALPSMPDLALEPDIPLGIRRDAVAAIRRWHGNAPHGQPLVLWNEAETRPLLADTILPFRDDGTTLDLRMVAGLLALLEDRRYVVLRESYPDSLLQAAGVADPAGLADLVAPPPSDSADTTAHERLLALFTSESPPNLAVLAALASRLPIDRQHFIEHLSDHGDETVIAFVRLLRSTLDDAPRERRLERWARLLEPQIPHSALLEICASPAPSQAARALDAELLTRRARALTPDAWVVGLDLLDDDATALLLRTVVDRSPFFPYDHVAATAKRLGGTEHPDLRAWAADNGATVVRSTPLPSLVMGSARALPAVAADRIATVPDADVGSAVMDALTQPITGLVSALNRRITPPTPNAAVCVGLLACFDEVPAVVEAFAAWSRYSPGFVAELDRLAVVKLHKATLPVLGHAWLYRWDAHVADFADQMVHQLGGPGSVLSWALGLSSPLLVESVFACVARVFATWRYRRPDRVETHVDGGTVRLCASLLTRERPLSSSLPVQAQIAVWRAAAEVLLHTNNVRRPATSALIAEIRDRLETAVGALPGPVREVLQRLVHTRGTVAAAAARPQRDEEVPESVLDYVRRAASLEQLAEHLRDSRSPVVQEACLFALEHYGEAGAALMATVLADDAPVTCWRDIAESVALWPAGEATRRVVGELEAQAETFPPEVRFVMACALADSRRSLLDVALAAARESGPRAWFLPEDWQRLRTLGLTPHQAALVLVESPQWGAHEPSLRTLMKKPDPLSQRALDALGRFLECGTRRDPALRHRVANRLRLNGDWCGLPILAAEALTGDKREARTLWPVDVFAHTPTEDALDIIRAGLVAGEVGTGPKQLLAGLLGRNVPRDTRAAGLLAIAQNTAHVPTQNEALRTMPWRQSRQQKLRRLAEVFAWGVRRGRELTGKRFKIHMIGGADYGYTRLHQPAIYVNPLPLLRGERDGVEVLRGLILHELGHHRYNASPEGLALWEQAGKEDLAQLFNLVCDEHLERNLRTLDGSYGDSLKRLAAYAFQHAAQEIPVQVLLGRFLGHQAFEVLSRTRLEAARQAKHVRIKTGGLLQAMEGTGMSFGRFVRGLRMGLGDRHGDPRVAEALALFKGKAFRGADMQELYAITKKLRDIFGNEAAMLQLLDQHAATAGESLDVGGEAEGIGDDELQREVERVLTPPSKRAPDDRPSKGAPKKLQINVGEDLDFPRIHSIELLDYSAEDHAALAGQIAATSRRMRRYLEGLGIRQRTERMRVRGHRLDRTRLRDLVLKGDPRVMKARRAVRDTDLFMGVLVDCSGSMHGDCIERARLFAQLLAEASGGVDGIDARFFGFTDSTIYDAGDAVRPAIHGFEAGGGNNDAAGLWHAAQVARASQRRAKLLVMISDGLPTECSTEAVKNLVKSLTRRHGIVCAQVAVRPLEEICFPHYVDISTGEDDEAVRRFGQIIARLVGQALEV